jgi:hypothetical protein
MRRARLTPPARSRREPRAAVRLHGPPCWSPRTPASQRCPDRRAEHLHHCLQRTQKVPDTEPAAHRIPHRQNRPNRPNWRSSRAQPRIARHPWPLPYAQSAMRGGVGIGNL